MIDGKSREPAAPKVQYCVRKTFIRWYKVNAKQTKKLFIYEGKHILSAWSSEML